MILQSLTKEQLRYIYRAYLEKDFPPDERRPLFSMLRLLSAGSYEALGLFGDESDADYAAGQLLGYALLVRDGGNALLDYLAVLPGFRGRGIGTRILKLLSERAGEYASLIIEIEDPAAAQNDEERAMRLRRQAFYARCGCRDTGVRADTFGVPYILLEPAFVPVHPAEYIRSTYAALYRMTLPKHIFDRFVRV